MSTAAAHPTEEERGRPLRPWQSPSRAELKLVAVSVAIVANGTAGITALVGVGGGIGALLIALAIAVTATGIWLEWQQYRAGLATRFCDDQDSFPFMGREWEASDETVIVTVDMSAAEDPVVFRILEEKARKKKLTLFAPASSRDNKIIEKLETAGARVRFFIGKPPTMRFSLLDHGTHYEQMLLGGKDTKEHWEIRRFSSERDLTRLLGHDVADLLLQVSKTRSKLPSG